MKKQKIFSRILIPAVIVLLLFPLISSLVFQYAAKRYAYNEAIRDLNKLQQNIEPLIRKRFGENEEGIQKQARLFLRQISPIVRRMAGKAHLLIFESRMRVIFPYEEQERNEVSAIASACSKYILSTSDIPPNGKVVQLEAEDGTVYLTIFYEVPSDLPQIKYLVLYCSTSEIISWVQATAKLVFFLSFSLMLLVIGIFWIVASSITKPLKRLCQETERIGTGEFNKIEPSFSLIELEELRLTMNQMSQKLMWAEEVQRDFFQNISHELRNPLMSISGYADGIEREVFHDSKEAAHIILEESMRMTELVNSLLTLSRIESGQNMPTLYPVRIIEPVEDCLDRVNGLAIKTGITLSILPFDHKLNVNGDEELICKVLENLLTNAIRYAKTTVTVSVISRGKKVSILVSDDGEGISKKDLPHLFERCYKGKNGNFGIGLAIAQSATHSMNGKLLAENQTSGGAVFTLILEMI